MTLTTTPSIEGHRIVQYCPIVSAEVIFGTNVFRDIAASWRDFFGGRTRSYETVLREAKETVLNELAQKAMAVGANAVVGVKFNYETVGQSGSMLMVVATGTSVVVE